MLFTLIAHRGVKSDWKTDIEKRNVFNLIKIHKFLQRRLFWFLQYRNMHVCSCKMIIITWLQDFLIIWAALSLFLQSFKCAWKQCMHVIFLGTGFPKIFSGLELSLVEQERGSDWLEPLWKPLQVFISKDLNCSPVPFFCLKLLFR